MGLTKRIFIEKDPAYEDVWRRAAEAASDYCAQFPFRVPGNRRNKLGSHPHWDPFWPNALEQAAKALDVESVNINGGKFFRTKADLTEVLALAELKWRESREAYSERLRRSTGIPPKA